jgi:hypothetical protein
MEYSSTILARNASSLLSHLSRLPSSLSAHHLLFTLSTNTPTTSLSQLVSTLSSLSASGSVGCLSAHPGARIACSLAFFRRGYATPFCSDIPGRPETQVGRWHAMRKGTTESEEEKRAFRGGELALLEEENVDWEKIWSRSVVGDTLPSSLRELRCVFDCAQLHSNKALRHLGTVNLDRRTYTRS